MNVFKIIKACDMYTTSPGFPTEMPRSIDATLYAAIRVIDAGNLGD
ncbi:hypothetical protein AAG747_03905 [Rapidithrix thailandica]|uniref:Ribulose-1,5-bisphosphate carboxylase/oxygenase large subunit n=1 Tax=Rapidithrix thailandica TaxID=413964 RepID=A0AAW9S3N7_9BACT